MAPSEVDGWISAYLDHLRVERALAPLTLAAYGADLAKLAGVLEARGTRNVAELDTAAVSAFLASLTRAGLTGRSLARHLSSLRGFLKFLIRERALAADPSETVLRPRTAKRLPVVLSERDVLALIDAPGDDGFRALRNKTMLYLLYACGLRVSELCSLRTFDVDTARGVISALGKGDKRRLVPVGDRALEVLAAYAVVREQRPGKKGDVLFFDRPGKPISRQACFKMIKRHALALGLSPRVSPHKLRHTFATHLLHRGADLRSVQTLLGHADISTTEIYTHVADDHVKRAHQKLHPRG